MSTPLNGCTMRSTPVKLTVVQSFLHSLSVTFPTHPDVPPMKLTDAPDVVAFLHDCSGVIAGQRFLDDQGRLINLDDIVAVDSRWLDHARSLMAVPGALRVWWIPQVPMKPFHQEVPSVAAAQLLLKTLACYDIFQFEHKVKPDFCNAGGLEVYTKDFDGDGNDGWCEWEDEHGNNMGDHDVVVPDEGTRVRDLEQQVAELQIEIGRLTSKGTGIEGIDTEG